MLSYLQVLLYIITFNCPLNYCSIIISCKKYILSYPTKSKNILFWYINFPN